MRLYGTGAAKTMRWADLIAAKVLIMLESCDAGEMKMLEMLDDERTGEELKIVKSEDHHLYLEYLPKMRPK